MVSGRLATLCGVIVDEDGELVGRTFGRPIDSSIIWYHTHPGVPEPSVFGWLRVGGDSKTRRSLSGTSTPSSSPPTRPMSST